MKKLIAKEFLILLSIIILSLLSFVFTYSYNIILSSKKKTLEDSISNTPTLWTSNIENLRKKYDKKIDVQYIVFNRGSTFYNNVGYGKKYETRFQFWNVILTQDYKMFYDDYNSKYSFWKQLNYWLDDIDKIYSFEDLKTFLNKYTINEDEQKDYEASISNYNYRIDIQRRIDVLISKMLSEKNQIKIAINIFWILLVFAYLLRYLIIAVIWSIKTLKT